MIQVGIIIVHEYRLLSIAAILDVFEAVNKIQKEKGLPGQYNITLFSLPGAEPVTFHGYETKSIMEEAKPELILIPSFFK